MKKRETFPARHFFFAAFEIFSILRMSFTNMFLNGHFTKSTVDGILSQIIT